MFIARLSHFYLYKNNFMIFGKISVGIHFDHSYVLILINLQLRSTKEAKNSKIFYFFISHNEILMKNSTKF